MELIAGRYWIGWGAPGFGGECAALVPGGFRFERNYRPIAERVSRLDLQAPIIHRISEEFQSNKAGCREEEDQHSRSGEARERLAFPE